MGVNGPLPLVLASTSPRRQELMRWVGVPFEVWPPAVAEVSLPHIPAIERPVRWAGMKVQRAQHRFPQRVVLGADTVVLLEDEPLGKPATSAEALAMLRRLQGRWHQVVTGFALAWEERWVDETVVTEVYFRAAEEKELEAYVRTGEPMDKAGAYAIQGHAAVLVSAIRGDYFNVVGLPVCRVYQRLREWGFERDWQGALSP